MHHQPVSHLFVAILILASATIASLAGPPSDGERPALKDLKVLADGCLSNRESFPSISCRFTQIHGTVDRIEVAVGGQSQDIHISATSKMRWIVDKQSVLIEQIADPAILAEAQAKADKEGSTKLCVPVVSQAILTNGSLRLYYLQPLTGASISGPDHKPSGEIRDTPFAMGLMGANEELSPGNMLTDCVRGKKTCDSVTTENVDGHAVVVVVMGPIGKQGRMKYWLDPERGFLPVRSSFFGDNGKELARAYWTDIRKCSGDRWFPWRAVKISDPMKSTGPLEVDEIRVVTLDVDKPPTRESFRLVLPKRTLVYDPNIPLAILDHLKEDEEVGLDDLPKLHQGCLDMAPIRWASRAKWKAEQEGTAKWRFGVITGISAGVLGVIAAVRWRYMRRRRPSLTSAN
jgi:hypothetical protein